MIEMCLVGTGAIASQHMKALKKLGGVCPRRVVSRLDESAKKFAEEWGFEWAGTCLDEALDDSLVSLVLITSPSELHAEQTLRALRAGKDVIVEIPVALSLAEADQVAKRAGESGRRVLVCHTMRSFPAIQEARRRVQAGELRITQITGFFAIPRRRNQSWAGQRHWIDNLLWHHGCHQVDASLWVLGIPQVQLVNAMLGSPHPQFGMARDVSMHFLVEGCQLVTHTLTYNTEQLIWELRFIGDEDVLTFRNGHFLNERGEPVVPETSWLDLVAQNSHMLAALDGHQPSDYDIEQVLPAMRVLHQAQVSAEEKL